MPRRPRSDLPEVGAYHVASRGTNHGDIYLDDVDRKSFMTILGAWSPRTDGSATPSA